MQVKGAIHRQAEFNCIQPTHTHSHPLGSPHKNLEFHSISPSNQHRVTSLVVRTFRCGLFHIQNRRNPGSIPGSPILLLIRRVPLFVFECFVILSLLVRGLILHQPDLLPSSLCLYLSYVYFVFFLPRILLVTWLF